MKNLFLLFVLFQYLHGDDFNNALIEEYPSLNKSNHIDIVIKDNIDIKDLVT